jgi:hypothetical protein
MLFMVVEHFAPGSQPEIYRIVREQGRLLPDGLTYIDSWISAGFDTCFQLMECDDPLRFQEWVVGWGDLIEIEIIPVTPSSATRELMDRLAKEADR